MGLILLVVVLVSTSSVLYADSDAGGGSTDTIKWDSKQYSEEYEGWIFKYCLDQTGTKSDVIGVSSTPSLSQGSVLNVPRSLGESSVYSISSVKGLEYTEIQNITKLILPNCLEIIGDKVFNIFGNLKEVDFGDNSKIRKIGEEAFRDMGRNIASDSSSPNEQTKPDPASKYVTSIDIDIPETYDEYSAGLSLFDIEIPSTADTVQLDVVFIGAYKGVVPYGLVDELEAIDLDFKAYVKNGDATLVAGTDYSISNTEEDGRYVIHLSFKASSVTALTLGFNYMVREVGSEEGEVANYLGTFPIKTIDVPGEPSDDSVATLILPDSVESVGKMESKLSTIGDFAFYNNTNTVFLPDHVQLGARSFGPGTSFELSEQSEYIFDHSGNLLTKDGSTLVSYHGIESEYSFNKEISKVSDYAFSGNKSITKIIIPDGIEWGLYPFSSNDIFTGKKIVRAPMEITYGEGLNSIPDYLFGESTVGDLVIPSTIRNIGYKSFYDADVRSLTIASDSILELIDKYAFDYNLNLTRIVFNNHKDGYSCVIGDGAFFICNNLSQIVVNNFNITEIGSGAFAKRQLSGQSQACIPASFGMESGIIIPSSVETIGSAAFSYVKEVSTNSTVIGENTLISNPTYLNYEVSDFKISFENGSRLQSIGNGAFSGIRGVTLIDLSGCSNLRTIGMQAFMNSYNSDVNTILSMPVVSSLETIESRAFYRDVLISNLNIIELDSSITDIGDRAFYNAFKELSFKQGSCLKSIAGNVLTDNSKNCLLDISNCKKLLKIEAYSSVKLPEGVYDIVAINENWIVDSDSVILHSQMSDEGKTIEISNDIRTINRSALQSLTTINCDSNSTCFSFDQGILYFIDDHYTIVAIDNTVDTVKVLSSSPVDRISDQAFYGSQITTLDVSKSGVAIGDEIFARCMSIADVFLESVNDISFSKDSFINEGSITFYVPSDIDNELKSRLNIVGNVVRGYSYSDGVIVYLPDEIAGITASYPEKNVEGGIFETDIFFDQGYTVHDVIIQVNGSEPSVDETTLSFEVSSNCRYVVSIAIKDRVGGYEIVFDGNGGKHGQADRVVINIPKGLTIVDSDIPSFTREDSILKEWRTLSGVFDFNTPITKSIILKAVWESCNPQIIIDTVAGDVYCDGELVQTIDIENNRKQPYSLTIIPHEGYELIDWICNGVVSKSVYDPSTGKINTLDVPSDMGTVHVEVSYTYYSTSSGLNPISNRGLPTAEELDDTLKAWFVGGDVDQSGMFWKGHSSVPLIVNDYVYLRIGDALYKIESDTGYVASKVGSISTSAFYHQLGYGNGLIVDYITDKVYDLDLNYQFSLDRTVSGLEYHDGYFYSSGTTLYRFPADSSKAVNGIMPLEKVGVFDKAVYSSYGFATSAFIDGYLYRVFADGNVRGITGIGIDEESNDYGRSSSVEMPVMAYLYLDDGWLSSYKSTLYLPGYTQGLFGSMATSGNDVLAYVNVSGLSFDTPEYYVFGSGTGDDTENSSNTTYGGVDETSKTFASQLVVYNDIGYIVAGKLHAFKMNDDGSLGSCINHSDITLSHGSIVLETSYATEENGGLVYVYMIPYDSHIEMTMVVVKCYTDSTGKLVMERVVSDNYESNYNSQAIRAGLDGRMIWYNDSGGVYSYTTPEKNRYFVFIQDGSGGRWYESTGASAHQAFSKLGSNVLTLGQFKEIRTVNGHDADDFRLYAIRYGSVSESVYAQPVEIQNLSDSSNNMYHYYVITDAEGVPAQDTAWKYLDGSELKDYQFKYNVGDRGLIRVSLVLPGSDAYIEFYDGDDLVGKVLGAVGSTTRTIDTPDISKDGKALTWDGIPDTFAPGTTRVAARWVNTMDAEVSFEDGMCHVFSEVKKQSEYPEGVRMVLIHEYGDNVAWAFTPVVWGDDSLYRYTSSLSSAGLTSVTVMLVEGSSYKDCRMLAIAECDLGVRGDRT